MKITIDGKSTILKGLLDTGNMLKDPITGFPVMVVEHESLRKIIPDIVLNNLDKIIGGDVNELTSKGGVKADNENIVLDEKVSCINNVIIGIYDKRFTKNGMYSAIFGLDILEGGRTNECVSNVKM